MRTGFKRMINRLGIGQGYISGYSSIFLGLLAIVAVVCFHYPEYLTSPVFREIYTFKLVRNMLFIVLILSMFFGLLSFMLSKKKKLAVIGLVFSAIAVFMGGFEVRPEPVDKSFWHIGMDWMLLDLFIMAVIFVPVEMAFPKRPDQNRFHEEWRTDMVYFAVSHLLIQFFGVVTQLPAKVFFGGIGLQSFQLFIQSLPLALQFFLVFFVTDFFQYWTHRFFHSHVYLWRFHSVHHSTKSMDWLAGSRTHFVDIFVTRSMSFIPLYVCGFSEVVFNTYVIVVAIQAVLIHANTRIRFGIFKYLFVTPQYHHWHHCDDPNVYGKNFAIHFPFIDMIFGTYYLPGDEWPVATGLKESNYPKGYVKQLVYPFTKSPFDNDLNMEDKSNR